MNMSAHNAGLAMLFGVLCFHLGYTASSFANGVFQGFDVMDFMVLVGWPVLVWHMRNTGSGCEPEKD